MCIVTAFELNNIFFELSSYINDNALITFRWLDFKHEPPVSIDESLRCPTADLMTIDLLPPPPHPFYPLPIVYFQFIDPPCALPCIFPIFDAYISKYEMRVLTISVSISYIIHIRRGLPLLWSIGNGEWKHSVMA